MKIFTIVPLVAILAFPLAGWAEESGDMPSDNYDYLAAKLMMIGYKDLKVVDASAGTMSGYDSDGSEVIIRVVEKAQKVTSINFVHQADH